jgi:hypothetical protein
MCECFPVISSANHGPTTTLIFANKPTVFHSPLTRRDFGGFTSNSYAEVLVVFGGFVLGFSMVGEPGGYKGYEREDCGRASEQSTTSSTLHTTDQKKTLPHHHQHHHQHHHHREILASRPLL